MPPPVPSVQLAFRYGNTNSRAKKGLVRTHLWLGLLEREAASDRVKDWSWGKFKIGGKLGSGGGCKIALAMGDYRIYIHM